MGGWDGDPDSQIVAAGRPASWDGDMEKQCTYNFRNTEKPYFGLSINSKMPRAGAQYELF